MQMKTKQEPKDVPDRRVWVHRAAAGPGDRQRQREMGRARVPGSAVS